MGNIICDYAFRKISNGDLVVYGSYPDTPKPVLSSGVASELIIRTHVAIASTDAITIKIDPSVVYASQTWVQQKIDNHTHTSAEIKNVRRAQRYFLNQI